MRTYKRVWNMDNVIQDAGFLTQTFVPSLIACARYCTEEGSCSSFFFSDGQGQSLCQLHATNVSALDSHASSNTVYYVMNQPVPEVTFECPTNNGGWAKAGLADGTRSMFKLFASTDVTQAHAAANCNSMGAHLLKIVTVEKLDFVRNYLTQCADVKGHDYWVDGSNVGASDYSASDAYKTADGEVVPLIQNAFWYQGSPSNPSLENCIQVSQTNSYYLDDCQCVQPGIKHICEKSAA
ncbi:uncharacterized protein LOC123550283 [Mercenaria mercenaria]|uniref:uncharacterized protein LOC123550283 n=1 Tax=Mercenaria mercenaria TaxID=6596 RepID=UPI00234E386D|nr:uncharacterized protein LOC123550283 [Mercenaria mercenaria]